MDLEKRLGSKSQDLSFLMVVAPGSRWMPNRGEFSLGDLRTKLSLLSPEGKEIQPSKIDPTLNNPVSADSVSPDIKSSSRVYILFQPG